MATRRGAAASPVSTILDITVDVIRAHYRQYLVTVSIPCAAVLLSVTVVNRLLYSPSPVLNVLLLPVRLVLMVEAYRFVSSAGVLYTWKLAQGTPIGAGEALKGLLGAAGRLLAAYFWVVVREFLYFLGLIAPYFVALAQASFVPHALLVESRPVRDAHRHSRRLVNADAARVAWILAFVLVLQLLALLFLATLPQGVFTMGQTTPAVAPWHPVSAALGYGLQVLGIVLVAPMWAVASTLLFYDIMVTREGTDLRARVQALRREYGLK